jgi:hypothetical protein
MSRNNSAKERIERLKREQEEAAAKGNTIADTNLVEQLTHEDVGQPDFAAIADKLKANLDAEKEPSFLEGTTKFTIYVDNDVAEAFKSLCIKRGDQRRYATQAFSDFVIKKMKELGL